LGLEKLSGMHNHIDPIFFFYDTLVGDYKMDEIERIIISAISKNLDGQKEKLDKIEIGVKNLIAENIVLKEEKKQILAQITNVRLHYSEYEGVWNALTNIIDTHS
jgi:hypothetical protein